MYPPAEHRRERRPVRPDGCVLVVGGGMERSATWPRSTTRRPTPFGAEPGSMTGGCGGFHWVTLMEGRGRVPARCGASPFEDSRGSSPDPYGDCLGAPSPGDWNILASWSDGCGAGTCTRPRSCRTGPPSAVGGVSCPPDRSLRRRLPTDAQTFDPATGTFRATGSLTRSAADGRPSSTTVYRGLASVSLDLYEAAPGSSGASTEWFQ